MKVFYKCHCMSGQREVEVPARPHDSDVVLWVECVVAGTIRFDHAHNFPRCTATHMEYVKIPVDEDTGGIGTGPKFAS